MLKQTKLSSALPGNPNIQRSTVENPLRAEFFANFRGETLHEAVKRSLNKKYDYLCFNFWTSLNYGAVLTAYALQELLAYFGYTSAHIDYRYPHITSDKFNDSFTDKFARKYLHRTPQCRNDWDFEEVAKMAKRGFIAGSDQVFRDDYIRDTYFWHLFGFAPIDKQRIALSASFGKNSFNLPQAKPFFDCFDAISVREDDGINFIKKAKHILDPVFLVDTVIFHKLADSVQTPSCKTLGYVLDETNVKFDRNIAHENVSVEEYLSFIKNADLVITDSFHGICFAILFNRPFISLGNAMRGNSRFNSLFRDLDISDALTPDWGKINARILQHRAEALDWIKSVLENKNYKNAKLRQKLKFNGIAKQKKTKFLKKIFSISHRKMCLFGLKIKF